MKPFCTNRSRACPEIFAIQDHLPSSPHLPGLAMYVEPLLDWLSCRVVNTRTYLAPYCSAIFNEFVSLAIIMKPTFCICVAFTVALSASVVTFPSIVSQYP